MNCTQSVGVTIFFIAAITHFYAGILVTKNNKMSQRWWFALSKFYLLICVELFLNIRHALPSDIAKTIGFSELYSQRRPAQLAALIIITCIFVWLMRILIIARKLDAKLRWALIAGLAIMCLFMTEIISLHQVDAIMYQPIGPLLFIGWLWSSVALAGTTIALRTVASSQ